MFVSVSFHTHVHLVSIVATSNLDSAIINDYRTLTDDVFILGKIIKRNKHAQDSLGATGLFGHQVYLEQHTIVGPG